MTNAAEPSIAQRLRDAGYHNKPDAKTVNDGRHMIMEKVSGRIVGRFDVFEAIALLKTAEG